MNSSVRMILKLDSKTLKERRIDIRIDCNGFLIIVSFENLAESKIFNSSIILEEGIETFQCLYSPFPFYEE